MGERYITYPRSSIGEGTKNTRSVYRRIKKPASQYAKRAMMGWLVRRNVQSYGFRTIQRTLPTTDMSSSSGTR